MNFCIKKHNNGKILCQKARALLQFIHFKTKHGLYGSKIFFYLLNVNANAEKVVFVVKRYAVRNAKKIPYAVCRLKMNQSAVRK